MANFDTQVFKELNEESEYWLGYLFADGNVSENTRGLVLNLTSIDKEHIYKFKDFLDFKGAITKSEAFKVNKITTAYTLKISCTLFVKELSKYNLLPRKSTEELVPDCLKSSRHFWRGMVDGDGWITNNASDIRIGLCGSLDVVGKFNAYIKSVLDINSHYIKPHGKIYVTYYNNKDAHMIVKHIYKNSSIYLDRKYNFVKRYLN